MNNRQRMKTVSGIGLLWVLALHVLCMGATGGDAVIYPNTEGQLIPGWGYDIKQGGKAGNLTPSYAQTLFVTDKMSILRVPIWGDDSHPAHPGPGQIVDSYYTDIFYAMTNARNVRPDVTMFASKKLDGDTSFPLWVKDANGDGIDDGNGIVPELYAILLADYLEYMEANGFVIDVLGIDNEMEYNEGNITPLKHKQTIDELRVLALQRGFNVPLIIGPDSYGPNAGTTWVNNLVGSGWGDTLDILGVHYYPQWRKSGKLTPFVDAGQGRPVWHSEVHWKNDDNQDIIEEASLALATIFDCFDEGFSGMSWWSYTRSGIKGGIEREISYSTAETRPVDMDDIDGNNIGGVYQITDQLITRAFRGPDKIVVWACNATTSDLTDYGFIVNADIFHGPVNYIQWDVNGTTTGTAVMTSDTRFELTLPANTVTVFEVGFTDDHQAPGPDPMTWSVEPYAIDQTMVRMTASTATDVSGVEYYFECTAGGGHDSGWQDSATYTDSGLLPGTTYTYRVKARDKSWYQNETGFSDEASGTTIMEQWPFGGTAQVLPTRIEAEDFDEGGQGFAYYDTSPTTGGGDYRPDEGVELFDSYDGDDGYSVFASNGEWTEYTVDITAGYYAVDLRLGSSAAGKTVRILLDDQELGTVSVPVTGSNYTWQTVTLPETLNLSAGTGQILRLEYPLGGFVVNWIDFRYLGDQWPYHGSPFTGPCRIEAEDFDDGGEGAAYHDTSSSGGGDYRPNEGVEIVNTTDDGGGYAIYTSNGEWVEYTLAPVEAAFALELRVACGFTGRQVNIVLDDQPFGTIDIPNTSGSNNYQTIHYNGLLLTGTENHILRLEFPYGGFNLNWIDLVEPTPCEAVQIQPGYLSPAGDLNEDCYVDMDDLYQLAAAWLTEYFLDDFAGLAETWMDQTVMP